jgi:hypothetical protein
MATAKEKEILKHHLDRCITHFEELNRLLKREMAYDEYQALRFDHLEGIEEALECGDYVDMGMEEMPTIPMVIDRIVDEED